MPKLSTCSAKEVAEDYDWEQVFAYTRGHGSYGSGVPSAVVGDIVSTMPFDVKDISRAIFANGERDAAEWVAMGQLKDERWFYVTAGCDYTGWD